MRKIIFIVLMLFGLVASASVFQAGTNYQVCFTPRQNCQSLVVDQIKAAKKTILVQAYSFTNYKIAKALVRAHDRGVDVQVVMDKSNFQRKARSVADYLMRHGIPVWSDNQLNIAHNKVMIFDNHIVETGSFNYTVSAQKYNAENVLIVDDKVLAQAYTKNWIKRQQVSKKMQIKKHKKFIWW